MIVLLMDLNYFQHIFSFLKSNIIILLIDMRFRLFLTETLKQTEIHLNKAKNLRGW